MIIEVSPGVFWNTELERQDDEAMAWLREEVIPKQYEVEPEKDAYNRPYKWVIDMQTCIVTITRIYISPIKWSREKDTYTVA